MGKKKRKKAKRPDWLPKDMQLLSGDTMVKWDGVFLMGQSAGAHIGVFVDEVSIEWHPLVPRHRAILPIGMVYDVADRHGVSFQRAAEWFGVDWKA